MPTWGTLIWSISEQILHFSFLAAILFERRRSPTSPSGAFGAVVGLEGFEAVLAFWVAVGLEVFEAGGEAGGLGGLGAVEGLVPLWAF